MVASLLRGEYVEVLRSSYGKRLVGEESAGEDAAAAEGAAGGAAGAEEGKEEDKLAAASAVGAAIAASAGQPVVNDLLRRASALLADGADDGVEEDVSNARFWNALAVTCVAAACLNLFMQAAATGPPVEKLLTTLYPLPFTRDVLPGYDDEQIAAEAVGELSADGQDAYLLTPYPQLLLAARALLLAVTQPTQLGWKESTLEWQLEEAVAVPAVAYWWAARSVLQHQRILLSVAPSMMLKREAVALHDRARSILLPSTDDAGDESEGEDGEEDGAEHDYQLTVRAWLEAGMALHFFDDTKAAKLAFEKAKLASGMRVELTGVMGRRTRFQTFDLAQLVLKASSGRSAAEGKAEEAEAAAEAAGAAEVVDAEESRAKEAAEAEAAAKARKDAADYEEMSESHVGPTAVAGTRTVPLEDDTVLLERVKLTDESVVEEQAALATQEQAIVLALCVDVKNSNPAHGLTNEQMSPYVACVMESPQNWMVESSALYLKALIEYERSKTKERAVLQLQALADQHTDRLTIMQSSSAVIESDAPAEERLLFVYSLPFPLRWELLRKLADRYLKMGVGRSALQIYEQLQLWDDVVTCYTLLGQKKKAEALVREQLALRETASMLCALGELTGETEHFERAWELSGHHSVRAKRSLARLAFNSGDYKACIAHFLQVLEVHPLHPGMWFTTGCAALRVEDFALAVRAFVRVVGQAPDDGEAWANLAAAYARQGEADRAFRAIEQAVKHKRRLWKVWENYVVLAIDSARFSEAVYGLQQLLPLRDGKTVRDIDMRVLSVLVRVSTASDAEGASVEVIMDADNRPAVRHQKRVAELLAQFTARFANSAPLWALYAAFNEQRGKPDKVLDCRQKQCRALKLAGWERDHKRFAAVVAGCLQLLRAYRSAAPAGGHAAARMFVEGVLGKAEARWADAEEYATLSAALTKWVAEPFEGSSAAAAAEEEEKSE
eukprot:PLAT12258.1.p1 GENE.PLAT12258.1~~PLAT12258.1.p1  ORF type:complete len:1031 (-),score=541.70 PLAT12258.1:65-2932(-)